jgi:hypothetical protein
MNNETALAGNLTSRTMSEKQEHRRRPKFLENSLLVIAGLFAHAPLYYQLPRWANGLDPTFVHHTWIERSSFPIVLYMAKVHPIVWILLTVFIFIRICRNYGWRLEK